MKSMTRKSLMVSSFIPLFNSMPTCLVKATSIASRLELGPGSCNCQSISTIFVTPPTLQAPTMHSGTRIPAVNTQLVERGSRTKGI